ncbi:MAG: dihydroorotase, partial [Paracoccaceae bacterium]
GTDSAPHTDARKLQECGCAGIFSATNTMSCLAEVFDVARKLSQLEAFSSLNGPGFYGLPPSEDTITLVRGTPVDYPTHIDTGEGPVTLFNPGFPLHWHVET